jgi:hypothetical protein
MSAVLAVEKYFLPPPLIAVGEPPTTQSGTAQLDRLAELAASVARGRAALREQSNRFDELFQEAERTEAAADELEAAAEVLFNNEHRVAVALRPEIEKLERNLARKHRPTDFARSLRRSAEEALDIGLTWLQLYQNLRIRLLKLASDRRAAAGEPGSPAYSNAEEMEDYLRRIIGE